MILGKQADILETFENPRSDRGYSIRFSYSEFTSLCPLTGQPDFGAIDVHYVPGSRCVELKSLKLYFASYRSEGAFFEEVTNRILDDLLSVCDPVEMTVTGKFNKRGGMDHEIIAKHPQGGN